MSSTKSPSAPAAGARRPGIPRIAGIVLAAGRGSRFAQADRGVETPKPLALAHGEPLIMPALRAARGASLDPILVVLGHRGEEVAREISGQDLSIVQAADWAAGLSASIRAGLACLDTDVDAALLVPADQPGLEAEHLAILIEAYRRSRPDAVAIKRADGVLRGAPALFGRRMFRRLAGLEGDVGARRLLRADDLDLQLVRLPDRALADIDTPQDLARFLAEDR